MSKRQQAFVIVCCALTALLTVGGVFCLTQRQNERAAQALISAVNEQFAQYREWAYEAETDYCIYSKNYAGIDPETREVDILFWIMPSKYTRDSIHRLYFNGKCVDTAWDDDEELLIARVKLPFGKLIEECRVVAEDDKGYVYQQSLLYDLPQNGFLEGYDSGYHVFAENSLHPNQRKVEGNTFYWSGSYRIEEGNLPFGSKAACARVYALDLSAGREVFSYAFKDGEGTFDRSVRLTPGKTYLRLYGEVTGQEGMKYRYFLGEVLQANGSEYEGYNGEAPPGKGEFYVHYDPRGVPRPWEGDVGENYNMHLIFPDQTMLGQITKY